MSNMVKLIKVDNDIHEKLTKMGQKNETYSDIIRRLLDIVEGKSSKK